MKLLKKSIAVLLSILMLVSLVTVVASAAASNSTVKFTNNLKWSKVYMYAWTGNGGEGNENAQWPGVEMTKIGDNGLGSDNYEALCPQGWNIIFNDKDNGNQTQDIAYNKNVEGYWLNGETVKDKEGKKDVYVALVWGDDGTGTNNGEDTTDATVVYGDPSKEGTYTATLDTGRFTSNGDWYAWTWTNNGYPGHFVKGTMSGNKVTFTELCNRVNFATFTGEPKEKWENKVAETGELKLRDGGTFTITDKDEQKYEGAWSGGTEVPEIAPITPDNPSGHKEGQFVATVNAGTFVGDGDWYAWSWTLDELNGKFVKGVVSGSTVTFTGLNNRVVFAAFDGEPDAETWSNRIAQTTALKVKDGGTYSISKRVDGVDLGGKPEKDYVGEWSGGVDVPDVPENDPDETTAVDIGESTALLDPGAAKGKGDWYAWTWNDGGAPGHWIKGVNADGLVSFDELCNNVIFAAFNGEPLKNWSNRAGQTDTLTVINRATFTIENIEKGIDSVSKKEINVFVGDWNDPPEETEETEETTEPIEETTVPETTATEPETASAETDVTTENTEATTASETTETASAETESTEATTETTEAESTAPEATKKYLFAPTADQLKDADELKLVVQDSDNNFYTYELKATPAVIDGKTVYSADVPESINKIVIQYQFYKDGKWVGQVVKSGDELKELDGKVVNGDGTVVDMTAPEATTEAPTTKPAETVAPTTQAPTEAATQIAATEAPVKVKKANPIKVTAKTVKVKAKKLKAKTTLKLSKFFKVSNAQGKVSYKLVKSGVTKAIRNKTTLKSAKVTFKKAKTTLKKGKTYKIKVKITAKGNDDYKGKSITKVAKIKIV